MARRREKRSSLLKEEINSKNILHYLKNGVHYLKDPRKLFWPAVTFVALEVILQVIIIEKIPYTEIDWKAYMQEVEGFLNGTFDYKYLKGDTGPLVYPAGFVYIFSGLYYITHQGINIKLAQYLFGALHVILLIFVLRIYERTKKVPPYILILIFLTSYRIHSIFVLRLFNDPVAVLLLYASINAFLDEKWYFGSILYSLAVSVKMNILLYAPALLAAYMTNLGYLKTGLHLAVCAAIQLVLGLPFLITNPVGYILGAFNIGRIFEYKWTVNWRFLSEELFVNKYFHINLLIFHVLVLLYFFPKWMKYLSSYKSLVNMRSDLSTQFNKKTKVDMSTMSQLFILPFFHANFIGICCSRSLHYQFYIWYYHTLPYLAWCCNYKTVTKLVILGIIELCWNTYPSTIYSSISLHLCHFVLMYGLKVNMDATLKVN